MGVVSEKLGHSRPSTTAGHLPACLRGGARASHLGLTGPPDARAAEVAQRGEARGRRIRRLIVESNRDYTPQWLLYIRLAIYYPMSSRSTMSHRSA